MRYPSRSLKPTFLWCGAFQAAVATNSGLQRWSSPLWPNTVCMAPWNLSELVVATGTIRVLTVHGHPSSHCNCFRISGNASTDATVKSGRGSGAAVRSGEIQTVAARAALMPPQISASRLSPT